MLDADTKLMLNFCKGDLAAFKRLVERNQRIVFNLAFRYLGDAADAEDVVQDVFIRVHGAADSYKPTAKFTTWVYRITVNVCLNRLRAGRSRKAVSLDSAGSDKESSMDLPARESTSASAGLEREELEAVVRQAMAKLPESQRTAVLLRRFDELSYEEIAAVMETTVAAVKSLLARARQTLKSLLGPYL